MFGLISKKRFIKEAVKIYLENDSANAFGVTQELRMNDFYYRAGNANALNGLASKLGIDFLPFVRQVRR